MTEGTYQSMREQYLAQIQVALEMVSEDAPKDGQRETVDAMHDALIYTACTVAASVNGVRCEGGEEIISLAQGAAEFLRRACARLRAEQEERGW